MKAKMNENLVNVFVLFLIYMWIFVSHVLRKMWKELKLHILQLISVMWNIMNHSGHSLFCELTPSWLYTSNTSFFSLSWLWKKHTHTYILH